MAKLNPEPKYSYKDVFLVPQFSDILTRSEVDTSVDLAGVKLKIPVFSANMDTITESETCGEMSLSGGMGVMHRFMSIEDNVREFDEAFYSKGADLFVSVGVNGDSKERFKALYEEGARLFNIDIAHGHSKMMVDMLKWIRDGYDDVIIMAGNVATIDGVNELAFNGANIIKVGIGPGNVCTTKNVTGVTYPQFSAVRECSSELNSNLKVPIVADGGISEIGDIAKAIAAGASAVMCGRMFASCKETPAITVDGKKVYRGMASKDAMKRIKSEDSLPTPEGISVLLDEPITSIEEVMNDIKGGLQSAMSYAGARNIPDYQKRAIFGVRH
jgi:IMP dehydrogenase